MREINFGYGDSALSSNGVKEVGPVAFYIEGRISELIDPAVGHAPNGRGQGCVGSFPVALRSEYFGGLAFLPFHPVPGKIDAAVEDALGSVAYPSPEDIEAGTFSQ